MRSTKLKRHVNLYAEGTDEQHEISIRADRLDADPGHIRVGRVLQPGEQDWTGGVDDLVVAVGRGIHAHPIEDGMLAIVGAGLGSDRISTNPARPQLPRRGRADDAVLAAVGYNFRLLLVWLAGLWWLHCAFVRSAGTAAPNARYAA
jgi:hypothetical protein